MSHIVKTLFKHYQIFTWEPVDIIMNNIILSQELLSMNKNFLTNFNFMIVKIALFFKTDLKF